MKPTGYTGSKGTIEVSAGNTDAEDKAYCISMRKKHNIVPGQSFGTLPLGGLIISEQIMTMIISILVYIINA